MEVQQIVFSFVVFTLLIGLFLIIRGRFLFWWKPSTYSFIPRKEIERDKDFYVPTSLFINETDVSGNTINFVFKEILFNDDLENEKLFALLAPTGIGKSSFLNQLFLNYEQYSRQKSVPLMCYGTCSDLGKNEDLYNIGGLGKNRFALLLDSLFENSKKNSNPLNRTKRFETPENTILLLDGFDEDPHAFGGNEKAKERLRSIAEYAFTFKKVILVSRIQFFDSAQEQPDKIYKGLRFHRLYLQGFNTENVEKYIELRHDWNQKMKDSIRRFFKNLPKEQRPIYTTPFILGNADSFVNKKDNKGNALRYYYDVYDTILNAWEKRENIKFDGISQARTVSLRLVEKILNLQMIEPNRGDFAEKKQFENLEDVALLEQFGKSHRTFLRIDDNKFSFAHRSIFEFFVAEILLNNSEKEEIFDFSGYELAARIFYGKRWKDCVDSQNNIVPKNLNLSVAEGLTILASISTNLSLHNSFYCTLPFALYGQLDVNEFWYDINSIADPTDYSTLYVLPYFKHLKYLKIEGFNIEDTEIEAIKPLNNIEQLFIRHCNVSNEIIDILQSFDNLWSLTFENSKFIGERSILSKLTQLSRLWLYSSEITDEILMSFEGFNNLTTISIGKTKITDKSLEYLTKFINLENIFTEGTQISDEGVRHLTKLNKIKYLNLSMTKVSDIGLKDIEKLKELEWLSLMNTAITDKGMEYIKNLINVKTIGLNDTQITNTGFEKIKEMKNLVNLTISGTNVSNIGLKHLLGLKHLKMLVVSESNFDNNDSNIQLLLKKGVNVQYVENNYYEHGSILL